MIPLTASLEQQESMANNKSTQRFIDLLDKIDDYATQVRVSPADHQSFQALVGAARRVLITGTGTSFPSAQYLAAQLQTTHLTTPTYFLPTAKAVRALTDTATSDDVVIIISHGFNRADALIIRDKAKKQGCKIIAIGGNPETTDWADLAIIVPPAEEKIFCRPISPLTTLIAIEQLCNKKQTSVSAPIPALDIAKTVATGLDPQKQTIVLYAADVSFAAELWAIMLREGAGLNVSVKDMENYAHGYYGPDTAALQDRQFIILKSDSAYDEKDFARAQSLYDIKGFSHQVVTAPGDQFLANAALFREGPEVIKQLLVTTGHDMYNPVGMDENRPYHEHARHTDY